MTFKSKKKLLFDFFFIILACLIFVIIKLSSSSLNNISKINEHTNHSVKLNFNRTFPELSYKSFTLIPESGTEKVLLLNQKKEIVHSWNLDAQRARLLPNCHLLVLHGSKWGIKKNKWRNLRDRVREYDFNGKLVWEHVAQNNAHHDTHRLENGNTIFLERKIVDQENVLKSINLLRSKAKIRSDKIVEVNTKNEVVWEWTYEDHFSIDYCGRNKCVIPSTKLIEQQKALDWTHSNTVFPLPENKWYNNGDTRFKPGNILILPRNWSEVILIDKETKKPVWKYRGDYKGGLSGGHEAQMIKSGLRGASNLLIFDNGRESREGASYLLEINPHSQKLIWALDAGRDFYSYAAGSMQRLPNGNTLISEDVKGRVFEITEDNKIAWLFQSKVRTARATKYSVDYCPNFKNL